MSARMAHPTLSALVPAPDLLAPATARLGRPSRTCGEARHYHLAVPTLAEVAAEAATCTRCRLCESRTNVVFGMGNPDAGLMFIGEGPGAEEDRQGLPFVGRSGRLLDRLMAEEIGIDRTGCFVANVVRCRPPGNRDPLPDEIDACSPFLEATLDIVDPAVVITLGNFATRRLLGTTEGITRLRGRSYSFRGGHLVPTFHPSAALRSGGETLAAMRADFVRAKRLLATAGRHLPIEPTNGRSAVVGGGGPGPLDP